MRTPNFFVTLGASVIMLGMPLLASAEFKVGFVDKQRAVFSSSEGKAADKSMTDLQKQKKGEMEPQAARCKKMQEELEAQKFVLSQEAASERLIEFRRCESELERNLQAAQEEFAVQQRKRYTPILKKFDASLTQLGKDDGFDLILDRSSPGVLYFKDGLDVTDKIITKMNGS